MGFAEIVFDFDYCDGCNKPIPRPEGTTYATEDLGIYLFLCSTCHEMRKP